jgi:hypothetical protein
MRQSAINRLVKNTHLLRYTHPSSLRRTKLYASFLRISRALHLDVFDQPVTQQLRIHMRRRFLILLLISFAAPLPCFAKTISPQLHPVSNTLWKLYPQNAYFGLANGVVYLCDESLAACEAAEDSFYTDFVLFAFFSVPIREDAAGFMVGFLPAVGRRGRMIIYNIPLRYTLRGTLLLANESWFPPE